MNMKKFWPGRTSSLAPLISCRAVQDIRTVTYINFDGLCWVALANQNPGIGSLGGGGGGSRASANFKFEKIKTIISQKASGILSLFHIPLYSSRGIRRTQARTTRKIPGTLPLLSVHAQVIRFKNNASQKNNCDS